MVTRDTVVWSSYLSVQTRRNHNPSKTASWGQKTIGGETLALWIPNEEMGQMKTEWVSEVEAEGQTNQAIMMDALWQTMVGVQREREIHE